MARSVAPEPSARVLFALSAAAIALLFSLSLLTAPSASTAWGKDHTRATTFRDALVPEGVGARRSLLSKTESTVATLAAAEAQSYSGCRLAVVTPNAPAHVTVPLAEPHRATLFELSLSCSAGTEPSGVVLLAEGPDGATAAGLRVTFTYTQAGPAELRVYACLAADLGDAPCSLQRSRQTFTVRVAVLYVRREVRSLSKDDAQRYFTALKTLRNYTTPEGQLIYGPMFRSYSELTTRHMAVAWGEYGQCNMGHNGPAFLPFHRAFVREFELALQAVDPSVASVYWDYIADGDLDSPSESAIWSADLYGSMVGDPEDRYIVKDGQFANWTIPSGDEAVMMAAYTWGELGPTNVVNPYGFLRSPEVNNPSPYLTRMGNTMGDSLPSRTNWAACYAETYLGEVISCIEKFVHVSAHNIIGGNTGMPSFSEMANEIDCSTYDSAAECAEAFAMFYSYGLAVRSLGVRDGCITCDRQCASLSDDPSLCSCQCVSQAPDRCSAYYTMLRFFARTDIPDGWEFAGYGLCTPDAYVGDYADVAASVNDPIFWPHHTNVDRVFASWRLLYPQGKWEDLNFTYPSTDNSVFPDYFSATNIVNASAAWPGVLAPGDGNPSGVCEGHGLWDQTLRGTFSGLFRSLDAATPHTNLGLLQSVDAQLFSPFEADYVYDTYEVM